MTHLDYIEFCENLFSNWKDNKIDLQDNYGFDLNALPEPYLTFGEVESQVCFLTTNPGGVMDFQKRTNNFSTTGESYADLSKRLGKHYEEVLNGAAKTRIENMYEIAKTIDSKSKGFIQVEISPFHSRNFPDKEKFSKDILKKDQSFHAQYVDALSSFLSNKNCICIQSGYPNLDRLDKNWITLISKIVNIRKTDWDLIEFKVKNGRATTGAFIHKNEDSFKVILFNSASNSCPKINSMTELFEKIKQI